MTFSVLTAEFAHETSTFNIHKTDYDAFVGSYLGFGDDAVAARGDANTAIAGFLDVGRKYDWQIEHVLSTDAEPAGYVTRDAFDRLSQPILDAARAKKGDLDGILLGLHGAMVTEFCEDGEGEFLARVRDVVGMDMPIAMTLDLHANVTPQMCELANIIVSYKTNPHVDMRDVARQAGEVLQRTMLGEIKPRTLRVHLPMLEELNGGRTDTGPMIEWIAKARAYEENSDVFAVSINAAFAYADIKDVGPTILVTYQGDAAPHEAFARGLADEIWNARANVINSYLTADEAASMARDYTAKTGPLVIADYADNPGGGGYGDSTTLLGALLDAGVTDACFGPMVDPDVARELHQIEIGDMVDISLGGKTDPNIGGGPLQLRGKLASISNGDYVGDGPMAGGLASTFGPCAVLQVDGIEILVVSLRSQMLDLQQFRAFGIDPAAKRVVALKSQQHFYAAFQPIAGKIIACDTGALTTSRLDVFAYKNVPRPIYPLDPDMTL